MAKKKRLQVPVSKDTLNAYAALAAAQKTSIAAVTAEILEETAPIAAEIAQSLKLAKSFPTRARRQMAELLGDMTVDADQLRLELVAKPERKLKSKAVSKVKGKKKLKAD